MAAEDIKRKEKEILHLRHVSTSSFSSFSSDISIPSDHTVFLSSSMKLLQRASYALIPSFLRRPPKPQKLHSTSYLDGLRGIASLIVFVGHYTENNVGWYQEPYGLYEDRAPSSPLQLPIIRIIYSGRPMVHVFFIISGFVLSYKPIKQIHEQQYSALANTLSSSIFRRAIRLFFPSFICILVMALAIQMGLYHYPAFDITEQLGNWAFVCWKLVDQAWDWNSRTLPQYNPALWTIPVEYAQSLLLFAVILGLARCTIPIRLFLITFTSMFCFFSAKWASTEFLIGFLLAELTILQSKSSPSSTFSSRLVSPISKSNSPILPQSNFDTKISLSDDDFEARNPILAPATKEFLLNTFWLSNLFCGLWLGSWPHEHVDEVWGLRVLANHTPWPYAGEEIWFGLGGLQIVTACTQSPLLQSIFTTNIAQYFGNISYALYLTHNLCLNIVQTWIRPSLWSLIGDDTFWQRHGMWAAGMLIYLPIVVFVADVFWRAVDLPSVRFARWLESRCLVDKND